jgi:hypothetical protein
MKRTLTLSLLFLFTFQSKAETWFDIGVKGAYAPGAFTNSHILSSTNQTLEYNHGYFFGGKIGVNFGLKHGITIDVLSSKTTQTLINNDKNNDYTVSLSSIDIPILYRNNADNGGYSEIGPQISITQSANVNLNGVSSDIKSSFNGTNMGVVMGFGQYVGGSDAFGFNLGLRFAYMWGDIVNSSSQNQFNDPIYKPLGDDIATYEYKSSGRLYAGFVLEANFNAGYITKGSRCSKRTKFKMF